MRLAGGILIALLTALAGCPGQMTTSPAAPADTAAGEVAFEMAGPGGAAILVPVEVNGQGPFTFVLDTGATFTCIDQQLAGQLGLPEQRGVLGTGVTIKGEGNVKLVGINSFKVGTATASDLTACSIDLQNLRALGIEVKGLVGLNFLKAFRVTLDFERNVLQLRKP